MPTICYTQLSAEERETLSLWLTRGCSLRRAPSPGNFLEYRPLNTVWQVTAKNPPSCPPCHLERQISHTQS
jgi:hypothetical protein